MSIENDTPILPFIVAAKPVAEWAEFLEEHGVTPWLSEAEAIDYLAAKAEAIYAENPSFAKLIRSRGNKGRDSLAAFMRHWIAAEELGRYPWLQGVVDDYLRGC
jgi:hypothetical protein